MRRSAAGSRPGQLEHAPEQRQHFMRSVPMQYRRLGSLAAACATITLAWSASASAADTSAAAPADCAHTYTIAAHRDYAKRVFKRVTISRDARHRLAKMRHCQVQG